jgi:hypothetical protein
MTRHLARPCAGEGGGLPRAGHHHDGPGRYLRRLRGRGASGRGVPGGPGAARPRGAGHQMRHRRADRQAFRRAGEAYYDTSGAYITGCVENSLSVMATDRIDLLLIHRPDPMMDHAGDGPRARCAGRLGQGARGRRVEFPALGLEPLQSAMETPLVTNQIELSAMHLDTLHQRRSGVPPGAWASGDGVVAAGRRAALHRGGRGGARGADADRARAGRGSRRGGGGVPACGIRRRSCR